MNLSELTLNGMKFHDILYFSGVKRTHNIVVATILVLKNIISNEKWTTAK